MDPYIIERGFAPPNRITVLYVSGSQEDHADFRQIIRRSNWQLFEAHSAAEALKICSSHQVPVVVCDSKLPDADWVAFIDGLVQLNLQSAVIIASQHADNRVWAQVFNLGAYDLIVKPFEPTEVLRAVALAWHSYQRACSLSVPRKPEAGTEAGSPGGTAEARFAAAG